jgi:ABC-type transporter lipoprotein component MlaA
MFSFNKTVDDKVLKPVATGYVDVIPDLVRTAISNFFGNIGDVWTAVNNYLQGKPRDGTNDLARVVLNSTFGIVGLIDVATPAGLVQHEEDFGQTLGVWGVKSGPLSGSADFGCEYGSRWLGSTAGFVCGSDHSNRQCWRGEQPEGAASRG